MTLPAIRSADKPPCGAAEDDNRSPAGQRAPDPTVRTALPGPLRRLLLFLLISALACDEEPAGPRPQTLSIAPDSVVLSVGDTVRLRAAVRAATGDTLRDVVVTWASAAPTIASVDAHGLVSGVSVGRTAVRASAGGASAESMVRVDALALRLERVATGLTQPLFVTSPPGDTARLFIVEQTGRVLVHAGGQLRPEPFLDLRERILQGFERGLLSIAFHPSYPANGRFFVSYTDLAGNSQIVEYRVSADPNRADPAPVATILSVEQPFDNHNGGLILFGPDGYLYIGLGDGGGGGDRLGHAQNRATLLGSLLRLDVNGARPYAIPSDNPFTNEPNARPEIWAYGLRNPWRFSFDRATRELYLADVGQSDWEEINVQPGNAGGLNYGWNLMEGRHCYATASCDTSGLVLPAFEYSTYAVDGSCTVIGGAVYRGEMIPALRGAYFFGDLCGRWVRSFRYTAGTVAELRDWTPELGRPGMITSFGEDARGELYLTTLQGDVFRIVRRQ